MNSWTPGQSDTTRAPQDLLGADASDLGRTVREPVCHDPPGTNSNAATSTLLTTLCRRWPVVGADLPEQPCLRAGCPSSEVADYERWMARVSKTPGNRTPSRRHQIGQRGWA